MDNASLSRKPPQASELAADEIPEAVRDHPYLEAGGSQSKKKGLIWKLVGLAAVAFGVSIWLHLNFNFFPATSRAQPTQKNPAAATLAPGTAPSPATNSKAATPDNLLGHLPYPEAPAADLVNVTSDGSIKLRTSAAAKYQEMANAAAASGIYFAPISGFRSVDDQQHVFFDVKAERRQNASKRAEVSAPPGYSEHHTGYAIDLGDGSSPDTNLSPSFENTQAFKWLEANATAFSFEMSFPKNNRQGVSYEPWHWRFVGDRQSLETFYKAHSLKK
ncbi:MAG: D-alanyl-D-alanine carboxypeptidase family protein [Microcoleus sp. PH2017_01_SCD_O_A]|uniref:M15 family metallopeptidase n=1 Tax=unclassified Microcoleus TaxID=2642155 RepID=UPI001DFD03A9|nr:MULTISPECIES: M15 family metallopeptidase [unclassified Microcoleus]MCC3418907.1 D-alanyl-D-alanine carboxypeptidase family protein [Microcoleus sp. PH2017_07_MST_O_A]MCC3429743.1 D-alanyl-D-alanine carboxypeptidase family protein [Microcoleus sp. PH2017_04_SCI_O_A]MCC3442951.1 D-alanyl-D-alanine carboxypeptidase family protein [Microcoleus sp. PH2017_03_ELD_O_A]MCC3502283.1 D-alanyl-D-alanine carboxypeptidase family protein [Microcoleus sp. PH2017_19_SFW_U_A]TAG68515.1 MAG: D-alanyl-D-alan